MYSRRLALAILAALAVLGLVQLAPITGAQGTTPRLYMPALFVPLPSPTPPGQGPSVRILEIVVATTTNRDEYLSIFNETNANINISGWRVINTSRSDRPTYTFPAYTLRAGFIVDVYTASEVDDLISGIFYWNRSDTVWRLGDVAELRDASDRLVDTYVVEPPFVPPTATRSPTTTTAPLPQPSPTTTTAPLPQPTLTSTLPPTPTSSTVPATPTRNPAICDPSYPTVCIAPPPDLNCGDISFRRFTVIGSDPHNFDTDNDGVGCESG